MCHLAKGSLEWGRTNATTTPIPSIEALAGSSGAWFAKSSRWWVPIPENLLYLNSSDNISLSYSGLVQTDRYFPPDGSKFVIRPRKRILRVKFQTNDASLFKKGSLPNWKPTLTSFIIYYPERKNSLILWVRITWYTRVGFHKKMNLQHIWILQINLNRR